MDFRTFVEKWKDKEVVVYCGATKYRGTLIGVLEDGFLVLKSAAIMNPSAGETSEYADCVLNVAEISGIAYQEEVGRGTEKPGEY
jgi:small nuclear ribonucleoprotein (snRNP)-like protein